MKYHNKYFYERKNTNMIISKMYVSNMILNLWVSLLKLWDGKGEVEVKENVMIIFLVFIAFFLNLNYRKKKNPKKKKNLELCFTNLPKNTHTYGLKNAHNQVWF